MIGDGKGLVFRIPEFTPTLGPSPGLRARRLHARSRGKSRCRGAAGGELARTKRIPDPPGTARGVSAPGARAASRPATTRLLGMRLQRPKWRFLYDFFVVFLFSKLLPRNRWGERQDKHVARRNP